MMYPINYPVCVEIESGNSVCLCAINTESVIWPYRQRGY